MNATPYMIVLEFLIAGRKITKIHKWRKEDTHGFLIRFEDDSKLYMFTDRETDIHLYGLIADVEENGPTITSINTYGYPTQRDGNNGCVYAQLSDGNHLIFMVYAGNYVGVEYDGISIVKDIEDLSWLL